MEEETLEAMVKRHFEESEKEIRALYRQVCEQEEKEAGRNGQNAQRQEETVSLEAMREKVKDYLIEIRVQG